MTEPTAAEALAAAVTTHVTKHFGNLAEGLPEGADSQQLLDLLAAVLTARLHGKLTWAVYFKSEEWTQNRWLRDSSTHHSLADAQAACDRDMIHAVQEVTEGTRYKIVPEITLEGEPIKVRFKQPNPELAERQRAEWAS